MLSHFVPARTPFNRKGFFCFFCFFSLRKRQIKSRDQAEHKYQSVQKAKDLESIAKKHCGTQVLCSHGGGDGEICI